MAFQKGVAQTIQIICYDSETPTDPTSPVVTVAKDTGSFTAATNSPTVVTPGRVVIALTATEMNADAIAVKVSSDNLEDQIALFYTEADYTATRAGYLNAGIDTRAPASSALDKATWTDARASRIDKLNVSGTLAHTDNANSFKATGFATAGDAMTLTSGERTNLAAAIWNWLTSAITTAGSIGKLILDNLNATISSRAPAATALSNVDWTSTRAGHIDKLNVSGTLANTDNANQFKADVSGVAPAGEYDAAMAKLDVAVSTRSTFDPATDIVKAKDHEGNPFITDEDVASGVWGAEKREVTGGTVDDISGRDLTNLDVAVGSRAVAGDAMTLTGGERSNIATAVWGATTRTLSSFGSLASDAAAAVWSAVARTITGGAVSSVGGKTLDNLDVAISTRAPSGEYDNEMAHLDADVSAVPGNVWEHDTRELTEEIDVGISESDKDDVADRVWGHTTRSLNVPISTEISSHDRDLIAAAVGEFARFRLLIADRTLEVKAPMQIADGRGNLRIVRDDDVVLPFVWTGTDLSGYTIYMTVRPDTGSDADPTDATATFQVEADITDAGAGKFEFGIGRTQTGACRTDVEYWYDVQAISPEGDITTLIIATLSVIGDVTRRTG